MTAQHAQGPGIPTSGIQSYPANIVPAGTQGQPYRGQGGQSDSDRGRTTPSSGPLEMNEEDIAHYQQLKSDHKELSKFIEQICGAEGDLWHHRGKIPKGQKVLL
jgi:hypothetical protein